MQVCTDSMLVVLPCGILVSLYALLDWQSLLFHIQGMSNNQSLMCVTEFGSLRIHVHSSRNLDNCFTTTNSLFPLNYLCSGLHATFPRHTRGEASKTMPTMWCLAWSIKNNRKTTSIILSIDLIMYKRYQSVEQQLSKTTPMRGNEIMADTQNIRR